MLSHMHMGVPYEYTHMGRPIRVWGNIRIWGRTVLMLAVAVVVVPLLVVAVLVVAVLVLLPLLVVGVIAPHYPIAEQ